MRTWRLFAVVAVALAALVSSTGTAGASPQAAAEQSDVGVLAGDVRLHSLYDWRCLDVFAGGAGPWVQLWNCNGQPNQTFFRVEYPDGTSEIRTSDYWCVDGRWGEGSSLERAPCTGHVGQRWVLHANSLTGGFLVKSVQYPNLVWDVHAHGTGTKVQLWNYNGGLNQSWKFERV
ncbi:RICIN domain-containing protein [Actinosynnema sp. NPDC047251]|uniref:Putative secreted protein n=1 Tax=Saccharothrix espanaensis (strain ATCC 51144 / DSM 44229 / JCM 9112 / NBRC 15066 / NRRL 15764) TaxID=1179773 RepID=K0K0N2_SACES|nr:RICIN domain-containing protein [Saccharothrix espanaensis]CCH31921.1 putative secreted protein [Saccharothrix espanaensis DSM 44229]